MTRLVFIVGMHRSGTSCLTGLLGDAGVWLGPVEKGSPHNTKGNNENRQVMNLNKAVLAANGAAWNDPPDGAALWSSEHDARADELLGELLQPGRITAMKDPRTLLIGDGWRRAARRADVPCSNIGTFRRPERVVASLTARDPSLDPGECLGLWVAYNRSLLDLHDQAPFPIVDFDLPADRYLLQVRAAFEKLGLGPPEQLDFFEGGLRHQDDSAPRLDADVEAIYRELQARSGR